ncbi:MAG: hypothetical protein J6125_02150 [Clostridia bacterium]|nr:hypothetical protein [Clostridia bacterium]
MKRLVSFLLAALLLAVSVFGFSSCGEEEDHGAEISVYLCDEIYDLDPAASYTDDNSQLLISLLFEPLFTLDDNGKLKKAAAKKYEYDKETNTLTITLRESYWSDGEQVQAKDYVYAWRRVLQMDGASPAASLLMDIQNAAAFRRGDAGVSIWDVGVNHVGSDTIRIRFERADTDRDAFLRNLASVMLSPVKQSNVESSADNWTKTAATLSCNGPFRLKQFSVENGYLTLARNDGYHRPSDSTRREEAFVRPYMIRTLWKSDDSVSDSEHLREMYKRYEDKALFFIGSLEYTDRAGTKKVRTVDRLSTYVYAFNTENPLFADPAVRLVLSSVIDRDKIVSDYVVYAAAATGLISPTVMDRSRTKSFRKAGGELISSSASMSVDAARARLAELGVTGGSFSLSYNADHPDEYAVALYVTQQWEALGFEVTLRGVGSVVSVEEDSTYNDSGIQVAYETGAYDVIGLDFQMMSANAFPVLCAFDSDYRGNTTGWSNADYNALIEAAMAEQNAKKKAELLHQAEEKLLSEMPVIPLYFKQTYYLKSASLRKVSFDYNGFPVFTRTRLSRYKKHLFQN